MTYEDRMLAFCANMRRLRKRCGLSKQKMAHILGVGVKTVNALEADIVPRRLGGSALIRAAEFFGISTDALFRPIEK